MDSYDFIANWRLVKGLFADAWAVLRNKARPQQLMLHYHRAFMVILGIYPNKKMLSNGVYKTVHYFILLNITLFLIPVLCGAYEWNNAIDMGGDFVWIIGISLILTKMWYVHFRADEIDNVIKNFDSYYTNAQSKTIDPIILGWERFCFLIEIGLLSSSIVILLFFYLAICVPPLFTDQELVYHAIYPFEWHRPEKHPTTHMIIYVLQTITSWHNLMSILQIELLGIHIMLQTTLNLKILCIEIRSLGELEGGDQIFHMKFCRVVKLHQHLIRTVEKCNSVFYGSFVTHLIASFALISVSTFETLVSADDPKESAKFLLFVIVAFLQLSFWCVTGNTVCVQSLEVAEAAFDIKDWHTKSVDIQRNIMFVIQRGQHPLIFVAKPFLPFTLVTYTMVLKQCFSILALLRETI
ncbi:odorant receptor 47b [Scaptodrosophila lebanonensis]|uniref:Odorant receptor n=1 Tax=Drosophila lebanonensis TaxID=7225 RepID=A0A6J2UN05_DROLE|nr:odorant receptor 47b [Scaptodrosophila lebanonensis]